MRNNLEDSVTEGVEHFKNKNKRRPAGASNSTSAAEN
jgi:hypothetical protein